MVLFAKCIILCCKVSAKKRNPKLKHGRRKTDEQRVRGKTDCGQQTCHDFSANNVLSDAKYIHVCVYKLVCISKCLPQIIGDVSEFIELRAFF